MHIIHISSKKLLNLGITEFYQSANLHQIGAMSLKTSIMTWMGLWNIKEKSCLRKTDIEIISWQ